MPSGTDWFIAQHERIRDGFDNWAALRRMAGLDTLLDDLAHLRATALAVLYPLADEVVGDETGESAVARCREDHVRIARIVDHVRRTRGPDLVDAVQVLCEVFVAHAAFEETAVLGPVDARATSEQLDALAAGAAGVERVDAARADGREEDRAGT